MGISMSRDTAWEHEGAQANTSRDREGHMESAVFNCLVTQSTLACMQASIPAHTWNALYLSMSSMRTSSWILRSSAARDGHKTIRSCQKKGTPRPLMKKKRRRRTQTYPIWYCKLLTGKRDAQNQCWVLQEACGGARARAHDLETSCVAPDRG